MSGSDSRPRRPAKLSATVSPESSRPEAAPGAAVLRATSSRLHLRRLTLAGAGGPAPERLHLRSMPPGRSWSTPCTRLESVDGGDWRVSCTLPLAAFGGDAHRLNIHAGDARGPHILSLKIGATCALGAVEQVRHGRLEGWYCLLSARAEVQLSALRLCMDGMVVSASCERLQRADLADIDFGPAGGGFSFRLPPAVFDGHEHRLSVRAGRDVLPGEILYKMQFIGSIDRFDGTRLVGWIADRQQGVDPSAYQLCTRDGLIAPFAATGEREDVEASGGPRSCGFVVDLPTPLDALTAEPRIVHAQNPSQTVFGPEAFLDARGHIGLARRLMDALDRGLPLDDRERWWLKRLCEDSLSSLRGGTRRAGTRHRLARPATRPLRHEPRGTTVVIPVHDGYEDTLSCLRSVHGALRGEPRCRVLIIDDHSPNQDLAQTLPQLCQGYGFELLRNPSNLGFVGSINRGLAACPADDVLLLNSDTLVPPRVVSRLRHHLRDPAIASVTPLSNNATILSYPRMNVENPLPPMAELLDIDERFSAENRHRSVEIPTAVGFCMLMRREAIDRIGGFDDIWDKGYCEENDWCMRAADAGYRHLAACDVFVGHRGGASFGAGRLARIERNMTILLHRYPEYDAEVQAFVSRDPLSPLRRNVDLAILRRDPRPKVLLISIALGGGIERHVRDQATRLRAQGVYPLILRAAPDDRFALERRVAVELEDGHCFLIQNEELRTVFQRDLMPLVGRVHLHTLVGIPIEVLDALRESGVRKDVTLHDYAAVCPRVTLLTGDATFCDLPLLPVCESCVARDGAHVTLPGFTEKFGGVEQWRAYTSAILSAMDHVYAPSDDLARRLARVLAHRVAVAPPETIGPAVRNGRTPRRKPVRRVRLAMVGAIGDHKGLRLLKALALHISAQRLPFQIVVIGYTADDAFFSAFPFVTITGSYETGRAVEMIRARRPHCALFLSPWPETWSYTLSEVVMAGVPVVALDLGAVGDRVRAMNAGFLLPPSATAQDICRLIQSEFMSEGGAAATARGPDTNRPKRRRSRGPSTGLEGALAGREAETEGIVVVHQKVRR